MAHADAARKSVPSLYEATLLQADVHTLRSREQQETGDEAASARSITEAESAFGAVAEYARSEPLALEGLCQTALQRMEGVVWKRAADVSTLTFTPCSWPPTVHAFQGVSPAGVCPAAT